MVRNVKYVIGVIFTVLTLAGCGDHQAISTGPTRESFSSGIDGSQYRLTSEPGGAEDVVKVRDKAKDADEIVVVGRIGGSENPWIEGRAAFSIVDRSLRACSDIPGDTCPQPWDYCCETDKLAASTALVKIVDSDGNLVKADARDLLEVKELATVVVKGTAKRDDAGNLTILASGLFVKERQ